MLTNTKWLDRGCLYPPATERARIDQYKLHERLFLSEHADAMRERFHEIARKTRKKDYDVDTVINYQQLLSKKTADFVCGEPPTLETEQDTDKLTRLLEQQRFNTRLYEAIIDVSRYGNAVLKFVGARLTAVSPRYWFPIVDKTDLKTISQHVIAYPVSPDRQGKMTELYVEIHDVGSFEQRTYAFDGAKHEIGNLLESNVVQTNLPDFAIQVLTNVTHSGSIYGVDDYTIINGVVAKIMWRLHCIDLVLDKHSEPSLSGPASALSYDDKFQQYFLDLGKYFMRNSTDDPDTKYITWDGNLDSAYKEVDVLLTQLYTLSEMGQAFMEGGGGAGASSGTALKLRMVAPRIKSARIKSINSDVVKRVVTLLALVNGISIEYGGLQITWHDGLPDDDVETTDRLLSATGGRAIMSQYAALKSLGLTDQQVEAELEQMAEEQALSAPVMLASIDTHEGGENEGGEE